LKLTFDKTLSRGHLVLAGSSPRGWWLACVGWEAGTSRRVFHPAAISSERTWSRARTWAKAVVKREGHQAARGGAGMGRAA